MFLCVHMCECERQSKTANRLVSTLYGINTCLFIIQKKQDIEFLYYCSLSARESARRKIPINLYGLSRPQGPQKQWNNKSTLCITELIFQRILSFSPGYSATTLPLFLASLFYGTGCGNQKSFNNSYFSFYNSSASWTISPLHVLMVHNSMDS